MPSTAILYEIQKLYDASDRLDSLSEQHPFVSEALLTISGSVRNTATLLEVLVATKMERLYGLQPADAWFDHHCQDKDAAQRAVLGLQV
jgi:hypothetical protein